MMNASRPDVESIGYKYSPFWNETGLRITNPEISIDFYSKHFGMTLICQIELGSITEYYLVSLRENETFSGKMSTSEGKEFITKLNRTALMLTFNHTIDKSNPPKINNGNEEPHRGFGHIAFNTNDVYESCTTLEKNGVKFKKRPDEGRMKGLAFALDPDGYWVEICGRGKSPMKERFNLSQTMIRIKDPKRSIPFYRDIIGMSLVREMHMSDFSNYFFACLPRDTQPSGSPVDPNAKDFVHTLWNPCLELTHNHGTETDPNFHYHSGNVDPVGFCHLGFLVNNINNFHNDVKNKVPECSWSQLPSISHTPNNNNNKNNNNIAAALEDPDGYTIKFLEQSSTIST